MKIILINAVYGIMSTGRTYMELQDFLQKEGHECIAVYGNKKGDYPNTIYMGNTLDHKCHALRGRITGKGGCYSSQPTRRLIRFLKDYQPDVVHLGNLHGNFINIPMLLKFLGENDIVTTVTLHDCYFFTGGCMHYTLNKCFRWQESCGDCPHRCELNSWFFDKSAKMLQYKKDAFRRIQRFGVVGVSDWITNEARRAPVFQGAKNIQRIYNWVNLDIFRPVGDVIKGKLGIEGKRMILGVSSGWGESKGLTEFLKLSELLGEDYVVVMVGQMPDGIQLPVGVISIPVTDSVQALVEYYSAADVFVHLSKEETFGKVVAEALACGTPVVVCKETALPELVEKGCGVSVDPEEGIEGVFEAVKEVLSRKKDVYSFACRNAAQRRFNSKVNSREYLNLWTYLSGL